MQRSNAARRWRRSRTSCLLDITSEGLRIQIVDKQNRAMFDTGSATLKPYTVQILHELAGFVDQVPNRISISGHTDATPYSGTDGTAHYGNWELSADRANAARRALLDGGMPVEKVTRVVGLAEAVPFDKTDPTSPQNRRISIVVMTDAAAKAAAEPEMAQTPGSGCAGLPRGHGAADPCRWASGRATPWYRTRLPPPGCRVRLRRVRARACPSNRCIGLQGHFLPGRKNDVPRSPAFS